MYDVIIIGKGPAGISASLYTSRGKLNTLVIGGKSYLSKSHKIDNYYGFSGGISGTELFMAGQDQAKKLGVRIIDDMVVAIDYETSMFKVKTGEEVYESKSVLLATGQTLNKVKIQNAQELEGKGVHYCVTCDGFFYNGLKVGILGFTDYAVYEALELYNFSTDVTIYTNGKEIEVTDANNVKLVEKNIKINKNEILKLVGENSLQGIIFKDGSEEKIDGIFVAYGSASSADFARKMGVLMNKDSIIIDKENKTNLHALFAAGDCTEGIKQISVAVGQGAIAGQKIVEYIRGLGK